jgi:hypothetical protein
LAGQTGSLEPHAHWSGPADRPEDEEAVTDWAKQWQKIGKRALKL